MKTIFLIQNPKSFLKMKNRKDILFAVQPINLISSGSCNSFQIEAGMRVDASVSCMNLKH